jgi:integrase
VRLSTLIKRGLGKYDGRPSEAQARCAARHLARHLEYCDTKVTTADLLGYRNQRMLEGAASATINREIGVLRTLMRDAADQGTEVYFPLRWAWEREKARHRVMTRDEYQKLLRPGLMGKQHWWTRNMLRLLVGTGARLSEVTTATNDDLDLDGERLYVPEPKEGEAKVIPLVNGALDAATALAIRSRPWKTGRPFCRGMQTTPDNEAPTFRRRLARACALCEIPPVRPHDLRRTFASWAIDAGATLEQVGQVLGHKSYETTRRYARIDAETRRKVAALVDA